MTAFRALRATPVLTAAAVALLSVAAGLNLAMFGLIDRAVLSPARHVADPARVFTLGFEIPDSPGRTDRNREARLTVHRAIQVSEKPARIRNAARCCRAQLNT